MNPADDQDRRLPRTAGGQAYPGTPRWVKVSGILTVVVIVVVVLVMLLLGGDHGPLRHVPAGSGPSNYPLSADSTQDR